MKKAYYCLLAVLFVACHKEDPNTASLFKDDGHRKAAVAFVPVIDKSDSEFPWSLSDEFTSSITRRLISRGNMHLADTYAVLNALEGIDESNQPFSQDLDWMKTTFKNNDFVVFVELVDHYLHTHPNQRIAELEENRTCFLDLTMRLRIVDLRGDSPKVVLQELIQNDHSIPKLFADIDYSEKHWGKTSFNFTPVGLAHSQLVREVASRVEDYISIAHSR
ncbi:MAG TPA: hypothetical protein PLO43_03565 [Chlamydiales bacterium]|nr:hypothetical protein [Chlamydiales bacterium]HPE85238.1 hypothetical protein [Chlamydiales bacterium]